MDAYAIGVVVGRLVTSYLIVFAILLLISKFRFALTLRRSVKWYGILATAIVFVLGISVHTVNQQRAAQADASNTTYSAHPR